MAKIQMQDILGQFRIMLDEHWAYVPNGSSYGEVDCSGAFVYAYRHFGKDIPHGSNAIARRSVGELLPVSMAKTGMAAFKLRTPEDKNYALPDKYRVGGRDYNGDLNDYYHIGLVDKTGKYVINAQSSQTGVVLTPIDKWAKVAYLNEVDYGEPQKDAGTIEVDIPMETNAVVKTGNGLGVNFRKGKSTNSGLYGKIPEGASVLVTGMDGEWSDVAYDGRSGYVMSKFLVMTEPNIGDEYVTLSMSYELALELFNELNKIFGDPSDAVG